jgi:hypothetical protein
MHHLRVCSWEWAPCAGSAAALSAHAPRKCIAWCDTLAEVSAPSAAAAERAPQSRTINARASLKR